MDSPNYHQHSTRFQRLPPAVVPSFPVFPLFSDLFLQPIHFGSEHDTTLYTFMYCFRIKIRKTVSHLLIDVYLCPYNCLYLEPKPLLALALTVYPSCASPLFVQTFTPLLSQDIFPFKLQFWFFKIGLEHVSLYLGAFFPQSMTTFGHWSFQISHHNPSLLHNQTLER